VNEQETAGASLTFLRDNLFYSDNEDLYGNSEVYQSFDKLVEQVPAGSNGVIFTPWLYGERTPVEDHKLRGNIFNISLTTKKEEIIRAAFEGVAYNSRWVLKYVEKFTKRRLDPLNIIGGGAKSDIWCQIYTDVLNRTIRQIKDPIQANARGAALIASVALGFIKVEEIPQLIQVSKTFTPNPQNVKLYNRIFKEFLLLYKNNKKAYHRLNS
jgi:xylulokinase